MRIKVDTHFHTRYSYDSFNTFKSIIKRCQKEGLDCVAITDHNSIDGAKKLAEIAPFKVIIGEEIKTTEGEVVGLFLKERIVPQMSLQDTINEIRAQDGVVYLPHPHKMSPEIVNEHLDGIDIIEVYNGRNLKKAYNTYALDIAQRHGKPKAAGSDSHTPFEIGRVFFEMEEFTGPDEFLENLKKGVLLHYRYSLPNIFLNRIVLNHKVRKVLNRALSKSAK